MRPAHRHPLRCLATVIRAAVSDKNLPNPDATRRLLTHFGGGADPNPVMPGPFEHQVLAYIGAGLRNVQVAAAMGLHPKTTYAYTNQLMAKLGVPNRMQLALCAYDRGLVAAAA